MYSSYEKDRKVKLTYSQEDTLNNRAMDTVFVMDALMQAMMRYGLPEILNTDQGSQFTSNEYTSLLEGEMIRISMDEKGRALDNILHRKILEDLKV